MAEVEKRVVATYVITLNEDEYDLIERAMHRTSITDERFLTLANLLTKHE